MSEHSPFDAERDPELGSALRDALAMPFEGAFVNRVRARLNQRQQAGWEDILARWFWQGLVAASLAALLAGWGLVKATPATAGDDVAASPTVASQLLDGSAPGASVLLASWNAAETQ